MDQYDQAEPLDTTTESHEFHTQFATDLEKEHKERIAAQVIDLVTAENSSVDVPSKGNKTYEIREIGKSPRARDNDGKPEHREYRMQKLNPRFPKVRASDAKFNEMTMNESPIRQTIDSEPILQKLVDECETDQRTPNLDSSGSFPLLASCNKDTDDLNTSIPDELFPKPDAAKSPRKKQQLVLKSATKKATTKKNTAIRQRKKSIRKSSKKRRTAKRRVAKKVNKRVRKRTTRKRKAKTTFIRGRKRTTKRRVVKRANRRVKKRTPRRVKKRRQSKRVSRKRKSVQKRVKKTKRRY